MLNMLCSLVFGLAFSTLATFVLFVLAYNCVDPLPSWTLYATGGVWLTLTAWYVYAEHDHEARWLLRAFSVLTLTCYFVSNF